MISLTKWHRQNVKEPADAIHLHNLPKIHAVQGSEVNIRYGSGIRVDSNRGNIERSWGGGGEESSGKTY